MGGGVILWHTGLPKGSHSRESGHLLRKPLECVFGGLDSRFRGNDPNRERPCLANDTTTYEIKSLGAMHA